MLKHELERFKFTQETRNSSGAHKIANNHQKLVKNEKKNMYAMYIEQLKITRNSQKGEGNAG